ncbi:MAG: YbgC/FadM family acyl-CoA thioesterase [Pseudomonadota bacterium]|uniref:YbgC/FadM family acyl-CoA thioesterase n=1 Tax=Polaromonas sp. TaxID=1869339 RepID=UPI0017D1D1B6|nr:YbgC/FadM family acyl-CoA thioesterase [Polaromonas sp.]MBA3593646.1 YbgC/FadM family acyl-CoA thioesterase [Polaromonas sp.]MDQ3272667.1 YbgC/FadM family acyl-CoA thioesterase [Pseudomonadota bacterium]
MKRHDFRFFHRLRVRWAEVDMQKIVFNAHYLMYFDTAVADYWRALALPYEETMHQLGGDLYVKKASVEYHGSARYDDQIDIGMKCARIGNSSMVFTGAIFRGDALLITCELIYVFADPATQTSRPVPEGLRKILTAFEAGETMVTVKTGSWSELGEHASAIRTSVFVEEQGIPPEMEWDEADKAAVHAVAYNGLGRPIATGRLLQHGPGSAKIGRMAVNRVLRGASLGRELLNALVAQAEQRGDTEVLLHAQRSAEGFYARLGFTPRGEPFDEVEIPHIEMVRAIGAKR